MGELCAASLVCTTGVNPDISEVILSSDFTSLRDLGESPFLGCVVVLAGKLLEADFLLCPGVRQDCVLRGFSQREVLEHHCLGVDQPHFRYISDRSKK